MITQLLVAAVLIGIFIALVKSYATPSVAFLSGLAIISLADVIPLDVAFAGFSNENLITIASLFVIARAIENTVSVNSVTNYLFGKSRNTRLSLLRIMLPVSISSAFINNTPVVAMLINPITHWAKSNGFHSSKFLIPLSYAAILGGSLTLIGTSTNLVVSGLLRDYGFEEFTFFELTKYSLPLAVMGLGLITWLAPRLLPVRKLADIEASEIEKKFTLDMLPQKNLVGKTIKQASLRNMKDTFLVEIIRKNGDIIAPVNPYTKIRDNDILRFSGNADSLTKLTDRPGLILAENKHTSQLEKRNTYIEAVVGHNKSIVGRTLSQIGFRGRYQAAVLAIFRAGERIEGSLGNIPLKPGDSLLLVTDEDFLSRWQERNDFLYIRQISKKHPIKQKSNLLIAGTIFLTAFLLLIGVPLPVATLTGALSTILFKLSTPTQARESIDFDLLVMIAAATGVAKGVESSGLANNISVTVIDLFGQLGEAGLLLGVILTTVILTEFITNAAAALLVFPIAIATATQSNSDPRLFAIAIAITASLSFISPLGYQTNTMVYSAGLYKFSDFFRVGSIISGSIVIMLTLILSLGF